MLGLQQHRIHFFVELGPFLFLHGDLSVGKVLVDKRFPLRDFFVAPIQAQFDRKPHRAAHVVTGHRIMGQRKGIVPMVVMTVDIVKQTANVFTQGVVQNERRSLFGKRTRFVWVSRYLTRRSLTRPRPATLEKNRDTFVLSALFRIHRLIFAKLLFGNTIRPVR